MSDTERAVVKYLVILSASGVVGILGLIALALCLGFDNVLLKAGIGVASGIVINVVIQVCKIIRNRIRSPQGDQCHTS